MPVGHRFPRSTRRAFFDLVCRGTAVEAAARQVGVSKWTGHAWWDHAAAMRLVQGPGGGGVAVPGRAGLPGGRGHRISQAERVEIMRGRDAGWSYAQIAAAIGRDKSVVWREVARNRNADGDYHALVADCRAAVRAKRPKAFKLAAQPQLCGRIETWMDQGWSPGLIAAVLRRDHPGADPASKAARVSHETIYQCLYVQARGGLRADLAKQLSTRRRARKPRGHTQRRGRFYDEAFTISDRPAADDDRAVPGQWEGDLIMGAVGQGAIGTLVERSTRFTILLHLPHGHGPDHVAAAMIAAMADLPQHLRRGLTWDRGQELQRYRTIQLDLAMPVYFCHPHSPWQRGTNENTNRLLRFWFAKGSDLRVHTADDLRHVQDLLNQRPRPTLGLDTPADRLNALLHAA